MASSGEQTKKSLATTCNLVNILFWVQIWHEKKKEIWKSNLRFGDIKERSSVTLKSWRLSSTRQKRMEQNIRVRFICTKVIKSWNFAARSERQRKKASTKGKVSEKASLLQSFVAILFKDEASWQKAFLDKVLKVLKKFIIQSLKIVKKSFKAFSKNLLAKYSDKKMNEKIQKLCQKKLPHSCLLNSLWRSGQSITYSFIHYHLVFCLVFVFPLKTDLENPRLVTLWHINTPLVPHSSLRSVLLNCG